MFRKKDNTQNDNFWISYADLMAGLLFVFILLIGAIVSKSIIMRENLIDKEHRLHQARVELKQKQKILEEKILNLNILKSKLKEREKALASGKNKIGKQSIIIQKQRRELAYAKKKIRLKESEIKKLYLLISNLRTQIKKVKSKNKKLSNKLTNTQIALNSALKENNQTQQKVQKLLSLKELNDKEVEKLNKLLLEKNTQIDNLNKKIIVLQNLTKKDKRQKKLRKYVNQVMILSGKLTKAQDELKLKDKKLTKLLEALDEQKSKYDDLIAKLQKQKAQIKTLTGIRLQVISALKDTLGKKIDIDKKTGSLRLSSNILFDKGSARLKDRAKNELKSIFEDYIVALMNNKNIKPHLERIVIEGHTDSDGGYLYNLGLSQRRALAVMHYLLTLPVSKKYDLKKYLVASGRAYLDPIMKNGREDKEASRRIEIKFKLKNRDAMQEIERIIDEGKR